MGSYIWSISDSLTRAAIKVLWIFHFFETAWIVFISFMENSGSWNYAEHLDISYSSSIFSHSGHIYTTFSGNDNNVFEVKSELRWRNRSLSLLISKCLNLTSFSSFPPGLNKTTKTDHQGKELSFWTWCLWLFKVCVCVLIHDIETLTFLSGNYVFHNRHKFLYTTFLLFLLDTFPSLCSPITQVSFK